MSFCVEFVAESTSDALEIVMSERYLPACVGSFIEDALQGCGEGPVYVKAVGHLYAPGSYNVSSATIEVKPMPYRRPPKKGS